MLRSLTLDLELTASFAGKVVSKIEVPPCKDGTALLFIIIFTDGSVIRVRPTSLAPLTVVGGKA